MMRTAISNCLSPKGPRWCIATEITGEQACRGFQHGALTGPLQDNGVVNAVRGVDGTPRFQLEGGDGLAAVYLSGRSPRINSKLAAGFIAVHTNNAQVDDKELQGSKSAHFYCGTRMLIPDDHGKGGDDR